MAGGGGGGAFMCERELYICTQTDCRSVGWCFICPFGGISAERSMNTRIRFLSTRRRICYHSSWRTGNRFLPRFRRIKSNYICAELTFQNKLTIYWAMFNAWTATKLSHKSWVVPGGTGRLLVSVPTQRINRHFFYSISPCRLRTRAIMATMRRGCLSCPRWRRSRRVAWLACCARSRCWSSIGIRWSTGRSSWAPRNTPRDASRWVQWPDGKWGISI